MPKLRRWEQVSSRILCGNRWIRVREDTVLLPNGDTLDSYLVVEYPGAVGVLFVEEHKVLLVKQFRYPIRKFTWEIPSGALSAPDQIIQSAERELREETGYVAKTLNHFYTFHPSPGSSNEVIHLVLAKGIKEVRESPDDGELFEVDWVRIRERDPSIPDLLSRVQQGEITHSPTIVALFVAREQGLITWPPGS